MAYPQATFPRTRLLSDTLVQRRRHVAAASTLLYQLDLLKRTGRYNAFKLEWHPVYSTTPEVWPIPNHLFWDSDVAKWIEGACYLLQDYPNVEIEQAIHDLVGMIRSAQQPDGYLNLHYTVVEPGKRFTNLRDMHELYNCGHLIEAALAHERHFHNYDLLDPILNYVNLLCESFGPGEHQLHGYPGHPEIELALLRLYDRTSLQKHLDLANYFVRERGNPRGVSGEHYYDYELRRRGDDPYSRPSYHTEVGGCKWYYSAHKPIIDQETVEGHSVRAMYLLTAAADLARVDDNNQDLRKAALRLWNNTVERKMYVTGGIGAIKQFEGFGRDFFLPEGTDEGGCYAETCASIGVMMLAHRILQYDLDHRFSDVMELCLYNAVLTAMSADGKSFTYVNQLASSDADPAKRSDWFTVACCPPNMLRLLGSIGGYIYSDHINQNNVTIDVHLYITSEHKVYIDGREFTIRQTGDYPWAGNISFKLDEIPPKTNLELRLRVPAFARNSWQMSPLTDSSVQIHKGYLTLPSTFLTANKEFTLHFPIKPRLIAPHPFATASSTLVLARGPLIYCVEDVDNPWVDDHFRSVQLDIRCLENIDEQEVMDKATGDSYVRLTVKDCASKFHAEDVREAMVGLPFLDIQDLAPKAHGVQNGATNGDDQKHTTSYRAIGNEPIEDLHFVPFFFRGNRKGRGHSRVGLKRR